MTDLKKRGLCKVGFITMLCCLIGALSLTLPAVQAKENIKLNKGKATLLKGETLKLKLSGYASKVKWSSSDSKVAKVSKKGRVTAKKTGSAKITAKAGGKKYTCKVKVENPKMFGKSLILFKGVKCALKVSDTTLPTMWESNNSSVVKVDDNGIVTAVSVGEAKITARVKTKSFIIKIKVTDGKGEEVLVLE